MDIREYLQQCEMLCHELERLKERIAALRHMRDGVRAFFVKEIRSRRQEDKISAGIAEIDALEDLYVQKVTLALRLKYDYQLLFDRLPDRRLRMLLELRYIDMLSYADISEKMYYSLRSCHNMHNAALAQLQKLWDANRLARCSGS